MEMARTSEWEQQRSTDSPLPNFWATQVSESAAGVDSWTAESDRIWNWTQGVSEVVDDTAVPPGNVLDHEGFANPVTADDEATCAYYTFVTGVVLSIPIALLGLVSSTGLTD